MVRMGWVLNIVLTAKSVSRCFTSYVTGDQLRSLLCAQAKSVSIPAAGQTEYA